MTRSPLLVVALGGNALLRRGQPNDDATQRANIKAAAPAVAELAKGTRLVVTHGNGPQVGLLALQANAYDPDHPARLDVLDAETEGAIGYLLDQELSNQLPGREVAAILTRTLVDPADPAFGNPTKPIGPTYTRDDAERLADQNGWTIAPDGDAFRRVVASPEPHAIAELHTIERLLDDGVIVIAAGGGGVPVALDDTGGLVGVDAVVDKDLAAALLAQRLGADRLVLLTDVVAVQLDFGTPQARAIRAAGAETLRDYRFAAGSMAPKVEAAARFADATGRPAHIGALEEAPSVAAGRSGTEIRPGRAPILFYERGAADDHGCCHQ
jgi:carbamate kinase